MAEIERILKVKEMYWHQKAKCKWISEGDGTTSFFYKAANGKKRKNLITSLMIDGEEVMNFENIANEAISFFQYLYKKDASQRPYIRNLFESPNQGKSYHFLGWMELKLRGRMGFQCYSSKNVGTLLKMIF